MRRLGLRTHRYLCIYIYRENPKSILTIQFYSSYKTLHKANPWGKNILALPPLANRSKSTQPWKIPLNHSRHPVHWRTEKKKSVPASRTMSRKHRSFGNCSRQIHASLSCCLPHRSIKSWAPRQGEVTCDQWRTVFQPIKAGWDHDHFGRLTCHGMSVWGLRHSDT